MNLFNLFGNSSQKKASTYNNIDLSNIYNQTMFGNAARSIMHSASDLITLKDFYKENPIVNALVDWKASRMSEIGVELYKVKDKKTAKEYRKWNGKQTDNYEIKQLEKVKAMAYEEVNLEEISINDIKYGKIKRLLKQPNQYHTWSRFVYHYSASRDMSGFQAIWGNRIPNGLNAQKFEELYPLPSHLTQIVSGGPLKPIDFYRVLINDWNKEYLSEDVLLLSSHSFDYDVNGSQLYGTSKIIAALKEVEAYKYAQEREVYSYQTGDAQTILFPKDRDTADGMREQKTLVQEWKDKMFKMLGQKNRSNISVSPYGLEALKVGTALKDTNTTESKAAAISAICGVWHINPIILGINATNTDSKIKEVTKMALRDAVFPEARDLNQGLNEFWMQTYSMQGGENLELVFDYDVFEEFNQDILATANALSKLDVLSDNEKRTDWLNYDAIEGEERANKPQKYWDIQLDPLNYEDNTDTSN